MFKKFKESKYVKAAATILISGAILIIFNNWISSNQISVGFETINSTLAPVYIGVIFAFILCPVYNSCVKTMYAHMLKGAQRRGFSIGATIIHDDNKPMTVDKDDRHRLLTAARAGASIVCALLVVGLVGLLIYFVVPQLVQTLIGLVNTLPQRLNYLSFWASTHLTHFPQVVKWINNVANSGTGDIIRWLQQHILDGDAVNIATMLSSGVAVAVKYVMNAFIGLLIMVYLLNYKERLFAICRKFVAATCGQKRKDSLYEFADVVNETFIGFIVGRIIDSFIIGILTFIVLVICDIPFALMISVIVGVTNVIPFFGPFIGAVPSVLLLMLEDPMSALCFVIIILVIQQIDGNVIGPKIVGNAIGISSFWVLIAVLIGGGLFGFMGMAFGVPVFAVIYRYIDKYMIQKLKYKEKASNTSDYFSLEVYGVDDDEIAIEHEKKSQESVFVKIKNLKKNNKAKEDESLSIKEHIQTERLSGEVRRQSPKVSAKDSTQDKRR